MRWLRCEHEGRARLGLLEIGLLLCAGGARTVALVNDAASPLAGAAGLLYTLLIRNTRTSP